MPESHAERFRRSVEELANFSECGDARGVDWLAAHPDDQIKAAEQLRAYTAAAEMHHIEAGPAEILSGPYLIG